MVLRQRLAPMRRRLLPAASGDWCIGGTQSGLRWAAAGGAWRVDATSGVGVGLIGNAAVPPRLRWATASEAARHLGVLSAHFSAERGLPKEDEAAERSELSHSPSATALRGARRERQATASDNSIEAVRAHPLLDDMPCRHRHRACGSWCVQLWSVCRGLA
jgi:hypothetical protein